MEKLVSVGEIGREESQLFKPIHIGFNEISSNLSIVYKKLKVLEGLYPLPSGDSVPSRLRLAVGAHRIQQIS